jgi:molybdopterin converting factor small subunit
MAVVHIPPLLKSITGGVDRVEVEGSSVGELVEALESLYPGIKARLVSENRLRSGLVVFVDGVAAQEGLKIGVSPDSEIHFVPGVFGGDGLGR